MDDSLIFIVALMLFYLLGFGMAIAGRIYQTKLEKMCKR